MTKTSARKSAWKRDQSRVSEHPVGKPCLSIARVHYPGEASDPRLKPVQASGLRIITDLQVGDRTSSS